MSVSFYSLQDIRCPRLFNVISQSIMRKYLKVYVQKKRKEEEEEEEKYFTGLLLSNPQLKDPFIKIRRWHSGLWRLSP